MKDVIESLMQYDFSIRDSKTVVELGPSFTFQRKGGDGGRKSANDIQFKIVPSLLDVTYPVVIHLTHWQRYCYQCRTACYPWVRNDTPG